MYVYMYVSVLYVHIYYVCECTVCTDTYMYVSVLYVSTHESVL